VHGTHALLLTEATGIKLVDISPVDNIYNPRLHNKNSDYGAIVIHI